MATTNDDSFVAGSLRRVIIALKMGTMQGETNDVWRELVESRKECYGLHREVEKLKKDAVDHNRQLRELKALLSKWVEMQKKDVEKVMHRMKTAEEEVHAAAMEWRNLFYDALELRVGEIGVSGVSTGRLVDEIEERGKKKKRARSDDWHVENSGIDDK